MVSSVLLRALRGLTAFLINFWRVSTFIAGALLVLAFAPFGFWWVAPLSMAILFYFWQHADSPRQAFKQGFYFGLGQFGAGIWWIFISFNTFGQAPLWLSLPMVGGLMAAMALFPATAGWLSTRLIYKQNAPSLSPSPPWGEGSAWLPLLLIYPAAWTLLEWIRGWFLTGFPWLALGYSQTDTWLAGLAPIGGVFLVSLAIAFIAGLLVVAIKSILSFRRRPGPSPQSPSSPNRPESNAPIPSFPNRPESNAPTPSSRRKPGSSAFLRLLLPAAGIALLFLASFGLSQINWTQPAGKPVTLALVQGNVAQSLKWDPEQLHNIMAKYSRLSEPYWGEVDAIIWPEAAIPALYQQVAIPYLARLQKRSAASGTELFLGILEYRPAKQNYFNSVLKVGENPEFYHKRHLVPFGEYFPVPDFIRSWLRLMNLPYSDFTAGNPQQTLLTIAGWPVGLSICYEIVFGEEIILDLPQAAFLINVSNDAWFGESIGPHQHFQIARMRAIETGRYLARATNTGITAVIEPEGEVMARLPQFEEAVMTIEVVPYQGTTPYVLFGNWLVVLLVTVMLMIAVVWRKVISSKPEAGS